MVTANTTSVSRPAESEPRRTPRERLIDVLALAMGGLAVFYYKPDGFIAGLIVFVGAYTITNQLHAVNLKSLAGICQVLLAWLAIVIHLTTLMTAPTSFAGLVFTFLLPGMPAMCAGWLALLAIWIVAKTLVSSERAQANQVQKQR